MRFNVGVAYGELQDGCGLDSFGGVVTGHKDVDVAERLEGVDELVGELEVSETGRQAVTEC